MSDYNLRSEPGYSESAASYDQEGRDEIEERYNQSVRDSEDDTTEYVGGRVETVKVQPKEFGSDQMPLMRKAAWQAAHKYMQLAETEAADGNVRQHKYWLQKYEEMLKLWEDLQNISRLTEPPF